jgi:hypothetical protein
MYNIHQSFLRFISLSILLPSCAQAFCTPQHCSASFSTTRLSAAGNSNTIDRRSLIRTVSGVAFGTVTVSSGGSEARASYSAYANREKDWQERQEKGGKILRCLSRIGYFAVCNICKCSYLQDAHNEKQKSKAINRILIPLYLCTFCTEIQFSSARDLKAQLREIAPMNNEKSKIFCPNGPSSNVDPMMENKCSDKIALPSVYGRSEDIVGNSIPGFQGGKYAGINSGSSTSLTAEAGGFPKYK